MKRRAIPVLLTAAAVVAALLPASAATAQERRFDLGLRADLMGAEGEPANDILGWGVFGHYRLNERWGLGFAVDVAEGFDVERPYEILGLVADAGLVEIDAAADMTALTAWIERVYDRPGRLAWFWGLGAGAATVDVADLQGTLADGSTFDLEQDVGTELLALANGGLRIDLGEHWTLELALRFEQHFTDWTVTDRVTGRTADYDDYLVKGGHFGLSFRF